MEIDNIRTIKKKKKIKNIPSAIRSIFFNPINIIIAPPLTATKRIEFLGYIASDIFGSPFSVNVRKHRMAREAQSDIHPSENRLKGWMTVVRSSLRFARWLIVVNGRNVYARANGSQNAEPAWNTLVTNTFPPLLSQSKISLETFTSAFQRFVFRSIVPTNFPNFFFVLLFPNFFSKSTSFL